MLVKKINKKPNFFIVGAPKCGTTALYEYLRTHPNIYFPKKKEPHYFARDFYKANYRYITNCEKYAELYEECTPTQCVAGDASVWYLYSSVALKNIYNYYDSSKIIVMLRNPIDMIYSLHSQLVIAGLEPEKDFLKAWHLRYERKKASHCQQHTYKMPNLLYYSDIANYYYQIERLYKIFPKEQVEIYLFDDFISSPDVIYRKVLEFLGIPNDGRKHFPPINKNKSYLVPWIGSAIVREYSVLDYFGDKIKNIFKLQTLGIREALVFINTRQAKRKPLNHDFRTLMLSEFNDDIDKLSSLLNRDLTIWKR